VRDGCAAGSQLSGGLMTIAPVVHIPHGENPDVSWSGEMQWHDPLVSRVVTLIDAQFPVGERRDRQSFVGAGTDPLRRPQPMEVVAMAYLGKRQALPHGLNDLSRSLRGLR
jgi:hypothetical protein